MQIHITRNGQSFGPYTLDEVNTYLQSGHLITSDMAWHDGAPGWMSLSQVAGVVEPVTIPAPPPIAARASAPPPTAPIPSGGWPVPPTTPPTPAVSLSPKPPILSDHVKGFAAGVKADAAQSSPKEMLRQYLWHIVGALFVLFLIARVAQALLSFLVMGIFICLIVGMWKPETFRFLFGTRTSKATVGWTFGAALFVIGAIGSSLEPAKQSSFTMETAEAPKGEVAAKPTTLQYDLSLKARTREGKGWHDETESSQCHQGWHLPTRVPRRSRALLAVQWPNPQSRVI